jgi:hypothetical protein
MEEEEKISPGVIRSWRWQQLEEELPVELANYVQLGEDLIWCIDC